MSSWLFPVPAILIVLIVVTAAESLCADPPQTARREAEANVEGRKHPLEPALKIAYASRQVCDKIKDFEATFGKREIVGNKVVAQTMRIKFRREPFSVYLKFVAPHEGREAIYVDGKNGGSILVRETGLRAIVGTVSVDPNGNMAMSESRYPITGIGIPNLLNAVIEQWEEELKYGEIDVKYYPQAKVGDIECKVIESSHPQPRKQFKFHKTRLYLDSKTSLPVRVEQFGFPTKPDEPPPLIEQYTYTDARFNVGLADEDFDTRNPNYGF